jgi:hypothetical protein
MRSTTISGSSPDTGNPMLLLTRPTMPLDSSKSLDPERADAMEMSEEMEKIFAAAKKGESLPWINWDGMEEAARLGPPQIQSHLAERPRTGSVGSRINNELTPGVRYRLPLRVMQGCR